MDDRSLIEAAVHAVDLPRQVKQVEIELGTDSTGSDSVTIWISIPDDVSSSSKGLGLLSRIASQSRDAVFASGTTRFPYLRYKAVRAAK